MIPLIESSGNGNAMKIFCAVFLAVLLAPILSAYDISTDSSGIYVISWAEGSVPLKIKMPIDQVLSDGSNYTASVQAAMQAWNARLGTVQFSAETTATPINPPSGTYANGNGLNEIVMDSQYSFGTERRSFDSNTLAITVTSSDGNFTGESDIVFNTAYTWNSYRGGLTSQQDIRRVAIHELGHVLGLNHPDQATPPQSVLAIMNSTVSNLDTMQSDDIAGTQLLYAAPGFAPANNDFANATTITLAGASVQLSGTNVAATRQLGEPNHAGASATTGHSVWWKWTAPSSGNATITTLGSNFDTALAVYTGSTITGLAAVASNDDAELPQPGVSNPQRKRTSIVTFAAASGTTYSIAVDGWGSASDGDLFTYTGAITLNLNFDGSIGTTSPAITTHPISQSIPVGTSVTFTGAASGNPAPSFQWKKSGVNIAGATNASYTIAVVSANDAGSYSVVASNSAGSATSNAALLTVIVGPSAATISITVE